MFMYDIAIHCTRLILVVARKFLLARDDTDQTWATKLVEKLPELGSMIDSTDVDKIKKNSILRNTDLNF